MNSNDYTDDTIMEIKDVLRYLRISRGTLMKLPIVKLKIRRRSLYRKKDIDRFVQENLKEVHNDSKQK